MKKFFRSIILFITRKIPKGEFAPVTYWKHRDKKYLYLCMSENHIKEEKVFIELFEKAIRISQTEFDCIAYFFPEIEIVTVADDTIMGIIEQQAEDEMIRQTLDEYEESEDKNINEL